MIILGVDPGTRRLGWGVVTREGSRLRHRGHGVVVLDPEASLAERLAVIETELSSVIRRFGPDTGSVESLFFHKDAQAAAKLGHARGVVLLCLARAGVAVAEYAPARVKRTVAGNGGADKRQVAQIVRVVLGLDTAPELDASDALALAITHLRAAPLALALEKQRRVLGSVRSRGRGRRAFRPH
jgi:crossover junction endodeoxyribonuclease RuvC